MSNWNENCTCVELAAPQRNNYFYGKLLDERNLRQEQGYLNQKRWMLNRLSLGKGVLCGLTVTWTEDRVCISPGVAIDGCGREIVVPEPIVIDPWQPIEDSGRAAGRLAQEGTHDVYICLAYLECPTDFTPVLVTECDNSNRTAPSTILERYVVIVKEVAARNPQPLPTALDTRLCGALSGTDEEVMRKDVCGVLSSRVCVDVESPSCVVIASRVTLTDRKITAVDVCSARPVVYTNPELFEMLLCRPGGGGTGTPGPIGPAAPGIDAVTVTKLECDAEPWATLAPDANHPPNQILQLGIPRGCDGKPGNALDDTLTKITKLSWMHEEQKYNWNDFLKDGLRVDFSNEVTKWPAIARGWFLVSLELSYKSWLTPTSAQLNLLSMMLQLLSWPKGTTRVHRVEADAVHVFNKNPVSGATEYFALFKPHTDLADFATLAVLLSTFVSGLQVMARVVIKCDFLVDKNDKPVDGNFLSGRQDPNGNVETGEGVRGGEFESWFLFDPATIAVPSTVVSSGGTPSVNVGAMSGATRSVASLKNNFPEFAPLADFLNTGG